jgi:Ca2+-binding RTX toxin-like protein
MSLATESVTLAGSGLVFINYYDTNVSDAYRGAIISAETFLQSHFTDSVTVNIGFGFQSLGANFSAQNDFSLVNVSYAQLAGALASHAVTADDQLAVAGLPLADPSNGAGFAIPIAEAVVLGLKAQSNATNDRVVLNSDVPFTFGQDAVGALEHEITEGVFGRTASLGFSGRFEALDLFRFNALGQRDFTGGSDGVPTFFGVDAAHVSGLQYHGSINAQGMNDGFDLGDWDNTRGDAFGPSGPNSPGFVRATDLQVLDVLGWTPTSSGMAFNPGPDDFASSLTDTTAPFGRLAVGGSATGMLQQAGDRDWFAVNLQAGVTYTISEIGHAGGGGTLGDPFLRLHDAAGNLLASNDDIVDGSNPDSRIVFTASTTGAFYVEAGSFVDGYAGSYRLDLNQTGGSPSGGSNTPTSGDDVLTASPTNTEIHAGAGNDTITGTTVSDILRGDDGDDSITGGPAFDDINGNKGDDTIQGVGGGDWLVGGQGSDVIRGGGAGDLILGNLGNDTLIASNGDSTLRGGQGDDSLSGGAGNDFISGDRGNDTMTGGPGADIFHSSQDAGIDKVLDFSVAEGDRVQLDPGTTFAVVQMGADTVIDMGGGNEVILVGVQMSTLPPGTIFLG